MRAADPGARRRAHSTQIRAYLLLHHKLTLSALARQLGVCLEVVSCTVRGKRNNPRVLDALRAYGVPEKYLFDPRMAVVPQMAASRKEQERYNA